MKGISDYPGGLNAFRIFTYFSRFKQPKTPDKNGCSVLYVFDFTRMLKRNRFFYFLKEQSLSVCYWHSIMNPFSGNSELNEKTSLPYPQHWQGHFDQLSDRFLKLTPLLQALGTQRYFASAGSFQVCGELVGMVQGRLPQSPPFISNVLWGAFRRPAVIDFRSNPTPHFTQQHWSLPDSL